MTTTSNCQLSVQPQPSSALRPETKERDQIAEKYKWNPNHIYPNWVAWEKDLETTPKLVQKICAFKGRITEGGDILAEVLELLDTLEMTFSKLGCYAHLYFDSDQRDNLVNEYLQKRAIAGAKIGSELTWIAPELLTIKQETIEQWLAENPRLEPHRFGLLETYRLQKHVLDEASEKLLSYTYQIIQLPANAYEMLATADAQWPEVTLSTGLKRITEPTYSEILNTNCNQEDRRKAFNAVMSVYKASINTYASLYNGVCQGDWCYAQSRQFESSLHQALEGDNIPIGLYSNLIEATQSGMESVRRYHRLRKRALKLESYDLYDSAIPLVAHFKRYPFDSVEQLVSEAVAPLGTDYVNRLKKAFGSGWIDVYENEGKRTGAYSMGVYGVHPYMLLNYTDTLEELFTVAHEMGHTLHSLYSHESQPYATARYTIFVAEVASTMNEALLLEYLVNQTEDPEERIVLLEWAIDQTLGTYFAQVRFAEFELKTHNIVESGKPITASTLDEITYQQLKATYGDCATLDPLYAHVWARIPHFFRTPFYVYQYATSFAASAKLLQDILPKPDESRMQRKARAETVDRFLNLLRSGGSDHPIDLLKCAGVDLTAPETIQSVLDLFDRRVTQLEEALIANGRL